VPEAEIEVLVIDDSALVRQTMLAILDGGRFHVSTAADPLIAMLKIARKRPDVIILDLEMPRMDGLTFLRRIMAEDPIPVVVCSSVAERGSAAAMEALRIGAVDIVPKPALRKPLADWSAALVDAVTAAAAANVSRFRSFTSVKKLRPIGRLAPAQSIVLIGASTGGTEAISHVLRQFPSDAPATVIVQHMPERFTAAFARRLHESCAIEVREAEDGDVLQQGTALIAPGDQHVILARTGASRITVMLSDRPAVNRHRPSADVLFESGVSAVGAAAVGVLLTGMGRDGAAGLLALRDVGAFTIAQDEATSIVFGMPKAAIEIGAAMRVCPLGEIAAVALNAAQSMPRGARLLPSRDDRDGQPSPDE
jgi:two-component system chemotaxis response regulator CheB